MFFDSVYRLFLWGMTFGGIAFVLWKFGQSYGMEAIFPKSSAIKAFKEFLVALWFVLSKSPVLSLSLLMLAGVAWFFWSLPTVNSDKQDNQAQQPLLPPLPANSSPSR